MALLCKNYNFFSLFFPGPPRADVASIQEKLHLGQNLKLTCPIQGDPTPLFEWFKVSHTHHGSLFCLLLDILTENWPIFHLMLNACCKTKERTMIMILTLIWRIILPVHILFIYKNKLYLNEDKIIHCNASALSNF